MQAVLKYDKICRGGISISVPHCKFWGVLPPWFTPLGAPLTTTTSQANGVLQQNWRCQHKPTDMKFYTGDYVGDTTPHLKIQNDRYSEAFWANRWNAISRFSIEHWLATDRQIHITTAYTALAWRRATKMATFCSIFDQTAEPICTAFCFVYKMFLRSLRSWLDKNCKFLSFKLGKILGSRTQQNFTCQSHPLFLRKTIRLRSAWTLLKKQGGSADCNLYFTIKTIHIVP